ncbi:MAG TPA: hypothetical protein VGS07_20390 [Thermoanaerobaculia bacterium]|nr:hypothetical protein [Thermoanaerobaculia bacterium]
MSKHSCITAGFFVVMMYMVATLGSATEVTVPEFTFKEPNRRFDLRRTIVISIRGFNPEQYKSLRARLFFKRRSDLIAHPFNKVKQCFVYDDLIIESDRLTFTSAGIELNDLIYQAPEGARYCVVVFEEGTWKPGPLMIEQEAVRDYFRRGFQFVIQQPTRTVGGNIRVAANLDERKAERNALAKNRVVTADLADKSRVCIHFRSPGDRTLVAQGASLSTPSLARTDSTPSSEASGSALVLNRLLARWWLFR